MTWDENLGVGPSLFDVRVLQARALSGCATGGAVEKPRAYFSCPTRSTCTLTGAAGGRSSAAASASDRAVVSCREGPPMRQDCTVDALGLLAEKGIRPARRGCEGRPWVPGPDLSARPAVPLERTRNARPRSARGPSGQAKRPRQGANTRHPPFSQGQSTHFQKPAPTTSGTRLWRQGDPLGNSLGQTVDPPSLDELTAAGCPSAAADQTLPRPNVPLHTPLAALRRLRLKRKPGTRTLSI